MGEEIREELAFVVEIGIQGGGYEDFGFLGDFGREEGGEFGC